MRYAVGCELPYKVVTPATMLLNVEPMRSEQQQILRERFTVTPAVDSESHTAIETGNLYRRLVLEPGEYVVRYEGHVELKPKVRDPQVISEIPVRDLPLNVLPYLYPSRYCQSDHLGRFALREFGHVPPGHERVTAICNWIYEYVDYLGGVSDTSTTAHDTFTQRAGVCRDFAHLGISFCRALGIPARFVSAYGWKVTPPDFHAVFEAYLGGRWYLFDATRLGPIDAVTRIGVGRDAADTSFLTYYGQLQAGAKQIWVRPLGETDDDADWTTDAVSVAKV
jgi:transglutaminase-like putative cysteine protease